MANIRRREIIYGSVLCASAWVIYGLNFYSTVGHSDLKVWFTCAAAAVLAAALITGLIVAVKRGELKELAVTTGISAAVILNAVFWSILPILFVCAGDKLLDAYLSLPTLFILTGVPAVCILALLAASAVRRLSGKGSGKTLFFIALAAEAVMITLSVFFPRTQNLIF